MKKHYKNLPKYINLGPRKFKLELSDDLGDTALEGMSGYTDMKRDKIVIRYDLNPALFRATLLHESLHAINFIYKPMEAEVSGREEDESYLDYWRRWEHHFTYMQELGLLALLRDNPKLVSILLKD